MVPTEVIQEIREITKLNYREESCGVVTSADRVIQITNVAKNPERCFVFSKREYFKALTQLTLVGETIQCIWHTHPSNSPEPSKADISFAQMSKCNSLIVTANTHRWLEYA